VLFFYGFLAWLGLGVLWGFLRDIVYSFFPLWWLLGASRQGVHIIRERRAALMFRDMSFFSRLCRHVYVYPLRDGEFMYVMVSTHIALLSCNGDLGLSRLQYKQGYHGCSLLISISALSITTDDQRGEDHTNATFAPPHRAKDLHSRSPEE
jgi:hypothetical protein